MRAEVGAFCSSRITNYDSFDNEAGPGPNVSKLIVYIVVGPDTTTFVFKTFLQAYLIGQVQFWHISHAKPLTNKPSNHD